jgi:hypothetical protein
LDSKKTDQYPNRKEDAKMDHLLEQRWKLREVPVNEKTHYGRILIRWIIPGALVIALLYLSLEIGLGSILVTFLVYITIGYVFLMLLYFLFTGTSISEGISRFLRRSGLLKYKKR